MTINDLQISKELASLLLDRANGQGKSVKSYVRGLIKKDLEGDREKGKEEESNRRSIQR